MKTVELTFVVEGHTIRRSFYNIDDSSIANKAMAFQGLMELNDLFSLFPSKDKQFYMQYNLNGIDDPFEYKIMFVSDLAYYDYDNYKNPTKPHTIEETLSVFDKFLSQDKNVDPEESLIVYVNNRPTKIKESEQ